MVTWHEVKYLVRRIRMCWYTLNKEEKYVPLSKGTVVLHFKREGYIELGNTGGAFPTTIMQKPTLKGVSLVHVGQVTR